MKIKQTNIFIAKQIKKSILKQVYNTLRKVSNNIEEEIKVLNLSYWQSTETYKSLISGQLTHEFGIPKGTAKGAVDTILKAVSNSIIAVPKLSTKTSSGTNNIMTIRVLTKTNPGGALDLPEALVETEQAAPNSIASDFGASEVRKTLPWLEWLLYRGNSYIIFGYEYRDIVSPRSRSGKGLMVKSKNSDWKVPAKFSGTRNSNWLTKALNEKAELESKYAQIIRDNLLKGM